MKQEYIKPEIKVRKIETECAMLVDSGDDPAKEGVPTQPGGITEDPVDAKGSGFSAWDEEF